MAVGGTARVELMKMLVRVRHAISETLHELCSDLIALKPLPRFGDLGRPDELRYHAIRRLDFVNLKTRKLPGQNSERRR